MPESTTQPQPKVSYVCDRDLHCMYLPYGKPMTHVANNGHPKEIEMNKDYQFTKYSADYLKEHLGIDDDTLANFTDTDYPMSVESLLAGTEGLQRACVTVQVASGMLDGQPETLKRDCAMMVLITLPVPSAAAAMCIAINLSRDSCQELAPYLKAYITAESVEWCNLSAPAKITRRVVKNLHALGLDVYHTLLETINIHGIKYTDKALAWIATTPEAVADANAAMSLFTRDCTKVLCVKGELDHTMHDLGIALMRLVPLRYVPVPAYWAANKEDTRVFVYDTLADTLSVYQGSVQEFIHWVLPSGVIPQPESTITIDGPGMLADGLVALSGVE